MRAALILAWAVVVVSVGSHASSAPEEKAPRKDGELVTWDGQPLGGRVVGFDVGQFEMSRKFGKAYVNGTEYAKLSKDQKYLVDTVLRANKIPSLEAGIRVWGLAPRRFTYRRVKIERNGQVLGLGLCQLSKGNMNSLLPKFTAWYLQRQKEIAATKAEEEKAALAAGKEWKLSQPHMQPPPRCPVCGSDGFRSMIHDTPYGKAYECRGSGHIFYR